MAPPIRAAAVAGNRRGPGPDGTRNVWQVLQRTRSSGWGMGVPFCTAAWQAICVTVAVQFGKGTFAARTLNPTV